MATRKRTSAGRSAGVHVALLRGINVGGKNIVPMADLAAVFAAAGATDVRTYIQSGNVVFGAAPEDAAQIASGVTKRIEKRFGFAPPVIVRSAAELVDVAGSNPYLDDAADGADKLLYVMFLAAQPDRRQIAALDPDRSPGDRYEVRRREIYLHLRTGAADTKLTNAYFDSKLGTISTSRNWRTVLRLAEMAGSGNATGRATS